MCQIDFSLEDGSEDLHMTVTLDSNTERLSLKNLEQAFMNSEFSECLVIDNAFNSLWKDLQNSSQTNDGLSRCTKVVAKYIDASLTIDISDDEMQAILTLKGAQGGKHVSNAHVVAFLKENNVIKGILKENLVEFVKQGKMLCKGEEICIEIARGVACINGTDGYIDYFVEDPAQRILRPKKLDNGNVDMRELGNVVYVKTGTPLAKLIPPTGGIKGFTVTGTLTEPEPGVATHIEEAEGSSFHPKDDSLLIATTNGMPKHTDASVSVSKLITFKNIDVGTGNIRFDGSIYIEGNVCESMKLYATGDIVVGGVIESAIVVAGGNISVSHGIIGHQLKHGENKASFSAIVKANGKISAQFVQYAELKATDTITVAQYISHCNIMTDDDIWVGNIERERADGKLFAVNLQSGGSIHTGALGSISGSATDIDMNYWQEHAQRVTDELEEKLQKLILRAHKIGIFYKKIVDSQHPDESQKDRIHNALKQHLNLIAKLNKKKLSIALRVENHLNDFEIIAYESISSGVQINVSSQLYSFKREFDATKVFYQDGKIIVEGLV